MSAGLLFIRSCVDHGARNVFSTADETLFTEEEQRAHTFVTRYVNQYGSMPTYAVLQENRLALPPTTGTIDYHTQRLADRAVYMSYTSRQQALLQAFQVNDIPTAREIFNEIYNTIRRVDFYQDTFELGESLEQAWEQYITARTSPGLQGMSYGWEYLDNITGGLRAGDVATIVARPGLGKSFTITKAAINAWQQGASVGFVSMEMTAVETARRIMAMETGVNPDFILRGRMSDWGEQAVEASMERMRGRPPFTLLVGDLSKSIADVDALIQERSPDFICIDASYLLKPSDNSYKGKKWEALANVAEGVKGLALRRNKPILQTVQFNRSQSPDEDMDLSQIGGTDTIGQMSTLVLGMKRGPSPHEKTRRRYVVLKNRHGPDYSTFETKFEFNPFSMDVAEDSDDDQNDNEDWNGTVNADQPASTEWSDV